MNHQQAVRLLQNPRISASIPCFWADLGCGKGRFTLALADLLGPGSRIYAVDREASPLAGLRQPAGIFIEKIQADFEKDELGLSFLDGILMANSLHFVQDPSGFIQEISKSLKANGLFLIVEYDMDRPNPWVPYPLSFRTLKTLFENAGWKQVRKLMELPSVYQRANIYSALIEK